MRKIRLKNKIKICLNIPEYEPLQESMALALEEHAKYLRSEKNVPSKGEQQFDFGSYKISWDVEYSCDELVHYR